MKADEKIRGDVKEIVWNLRRDPTVVINMECLSADEAQAMFELLSEEHQDRTAFSWRFGRQADVVVRLRKFVRPRRGSDVRVGDAGVSR